MDISQIGPLWLQILTLFIGAGGIGTVVLGISRWFNSREMKVQLRRKEESRMDRRAAAAERRLEAASWEREIAEAHREAAATYGEQRSEFSSPSKS